MSKTKSINAFARRITRNNPSDRRDNMSSMMNPSGKTPQQPLVVTNPKPIKPLTWPVHPVVQTLFTVHILNKDGIWVASALRGGHLAALAGAIANRTFQFGWFCTTCTERKCDCNYPYAGRKVTRPRALLREKN